MEKKVIYKILVSIIFILCVINLKKWITFAIKYELTIICYCVHSIYIDIGLLLCDVINPY